MRISRVVRGLTTRSEPARERDTAKLLARPPHLSAMDLSFHFTAAGERLHCRIGRETDPKETEKLLEEPPEGENGALTDTPAATKDIESIAFTTKNSTHTLASPKENTTKYFLRYFYPSSETKGKGERITPFAVALLIVLLAVYVLNQADRLVLPVVIPAGLRCSVEKDTCPGSNSSTNTSTTGSDGNSSDVDCIRFNDDQQGLLTGIYVMSYFTAILQLIQLLTVYEMHIPQYIEFEMQNRSFTFSKCLFSQVQLSL